MWLRQAKNVYKTFDNSRRYPTYHRPNVWLRNDLDWIEDLNVESAFCFKESDNVDDLGRPSKKEKNAGSILVVIKYDYADGSQFASNASHFLQIAKFVTSMHKAGIIHGEVRGFNVLHPAIVS
eukprot:scaffold15807_cov124-Cylindrotheca_fusiformis.AAC.1